MDSPSRLVVVGLPTLILRCLSTTFKSGQRCNFRTVLIIPRITFSHRKQSMASQRPRRCLIILYSRLIHWLPKSVSGHHTAHLRLIVRAVPSRRARDSPGTDLFLVYAQRFNIVSQLPPTGQGQSSQKGTNPGPSTGKHLLKCARRTGRYNMRDIVPLARLRTLVDLVPRFGKQAKRELAKETGLEYSSEFWLNKYFEKELFCAFKGI